MHLEKSIDIIPNADPLAFLNMRKGIDIPTLAQLKLCFHKEPPMIGIQTCRRTFEEYKDAISNHAVDNVDI
jgi:hypothetical protein